MAAVDEQNSADNPSQLILEPLPWRTRDSVASVEQDYIIRVIGESTSLGVAQIT